MLLLQREKKRDRERRRERERARHLVTLACWEE